MPTTVDCFSGTLRVRVTKSGTWTLKLTLPPAGTTPGQLFNGTVSGSLTVPANGFTADLSQLCAGTTVTGPTTAKTFTGTYDMSTGVVTASPVPQAFPVTYTGCTVLNTRLTSASFQLNPIIDLQW
ncbi:hypothetical protein [Knoellia remsis]|uniref:hypothetical protein n=1 Tax=Knoellia remsis TaxID=407159 RepID=UPI0011B1FF6A|nr:hypothetical protein [Knoellia remsis]